MDIFYILMYVVGKNRYNLYTLSFVQIIYSLDDQKTTHIHSKLKKINWSELLEIH